MQKLKTRVVKKNTNPEWNEELTLTVADPNLPIKVVSAEIQAESSLRRTFLANESFHLLVMQLVYDKDTFTLDDKMGDAEFHIGPFLEAQRMRLDSYPGGTVISRVQPSRQNCYAQESCIVWKDGKVVQNMVLRLRNVESGEVELQIRWVDVPGSRGLSS